MEDCCTICNYSIWITVKVDLPVLLSLFINKLWCAAAYKMIENIIPILQANCLFKSNISYYKKIMQN